MKETVQKANLDWSELPFAYVKTDGHLEYYYRKGAWNDGEVVEGDTIALPMSATCLHYGQEVFEGLKVFEAADGRALAFRPDENAGRMDRSAKKLVMIPPPADLFIGAVERVVRINKRFIPPYGSGASLYIRPLLLGVSGIIGVKPSEDYLFLVFSTPVGPYFKGGLKPIRLRIEEGVDRAAPLGVGDAKTGGNYAAGLRAGVAARRDGFAESLYVDAKEKVYIDETNASNFFGITRDGTYVTPDADTILPSITNKSLMQLAKDLGMKVERRPIHIDELPAFVEAGAVGTAAVITPVHEIEYRGEKIRYGSPDEIGPTCRKLYEALTAIQSGDAEDTHGWTHEIDVG